MPSSVGIQRRRLLRFPDKMSVGFYREAVTDLSPGTTIHPPIPIIIGPITIIVGTAGVIAIIGEQTISFLRQKPAHRLRDAAGIRPISIFQDRRERHRYIR